MDYEDISSRLQPDISLASNYSTDPDVSVPSTTSLTAWGILLPWLFLGPILHTVSRLPRLPSNPSTVIESKSKKSKKWKWRTTFIARLCAATTGCWAVLVLCISPTLWSNLWLANCLSAQSLVCFSLGVHIAEAVDMILHTRPGLLWVHHLLIIFCFSGVLLTEKAVGFVVLSLVTELNVVFNKTRFLQTMTRRDHHSVESSRATRTTEHLHILRHSGG
eukprot:GFUD01002591.1.p1 GENE.GFUD01002591.1~~GFUD01002591.1.p1  ORF type:complete len:219 (+),score=53.11 GFUD01002591.1:112-768(+)